MAVQDKVMLLNQVEETLKPRMFANLLEEATQEIQNTLDEYDITHISSGGGSSATDNMLEAYINAKTVEGRSEKTLVRYQYTIKRFMNFANVKTREVTTYHIRSYFEHEQNRGISDRTIEGIREVLNAYFGWLEHEKLIPMNPAFNINVIHVQKKIRDAFTDVDIYRMRRYCDNVRDLAIINLLLSTGCRISEVVGLNRDDIDFEKNECIVLGKGNKERTVYLNDVASVTLKEYLETRTDDNPALFPGMKKDRLCAGGIRRALKNLEKLSGVKNIHPHRFRRTLITELLNNGMAIQEVAIIAGHDKLDTTMKYFSVNKSKIKNSYQKYSA